MINMESDPLSFQLQLVEKLGETAGTKSVLLSRLKKKFGSSPLLRELELISV